MQLRSYRNVKINLPLFIILTVLIAFSCKKEENHRPPLIEFIDDSDFVSRDTSLPAGAKILVSLKATDPDDHITFFEVVRDNGNRQILLDSGMNCPGFVYKLSILKSNDLFEKWIFKVMDRERNIDSTFLLLERSAVNEYGNIKTLEDITLSAQDLKEPGSFFSISTGEAYCLDTAYTRQEITDIIYYFSEFESTLSSPNESDAPAVFTGPSGLANWTVKSETRYDTTLLAPSDFDQAQNDSLLIACYEPTTGKRKLKYAKLGMVISFISPAYKIGLLYVKEILPGPEGYIKFSIKVQE